MYNLPQDKWNSEFNYKLILYPFDLSFFSVCNPTLTILHYTIHMQARPSLSSLFLCISCGKNQRQINCIEVCIGAKGLKLSHSSQVGIIKCNSFSMDNNKTFVMYSTLCTPSVYHKTWLFLLVYFIIAHFFFCGLVLSLMVSKWSCVTYRKCLQHFAAINESSIKPKIDIFFTLQLINS